MMRGMSLTFEKRCHDYRQIPMDLLTGTGIESSNLVLRALIKGPDKRPDSGHSLAT